MAALNTAITNERIKFWLDFKSSQNSLYSSLGTSIWFEGLAELRSLSLISFYKSDIELTNKERTTFKYLDSLIAMQNHVAFKGFDIIGDMHLRYSSVLYNYLNAFSLDQNTQYYFDLSEHGSFKPWTNEISLSKEFFKIKDGRIKVPFYALNHERAHLLFRDYYSDINIPDSDLALLFILIEWFCISLDFLLAYDLLRTNSLSCLEELESITNYNKRGFGQFFKKNCQKICNVNKIAAEFRNSFLSVGNKSEYSVISKETVGSHTAYAEGKLLTDCRRIEKKVTAAEAYRMINLLRDSSLTNIVESLTGINYES